MRQGEDIDRVKIFLFANTSWYLWNFRARLGLKLLKEGHQVTYCAPFDNYSDRLAAMSRFLNIPIDRKGRNPFREIFSVLKVALVLHREKPDVLLTWTPKPNIYGALAGRFLGIHVIPNVAGLGYAFIGGKLLARITGVLYKFAFARCRIVFFQNSDDRKKFETAGWVQRRATRLLPGSGVDLERFKPSAFMSSKREVSFLFIGRFLADKGLRELVKAVRRLRKEGLRFQLKLVGFIDEGNPAAVPRDEIKEWARQGLVEYLGPTDCSEEVLEQVNCVVLPSYYREGVPRSLLEAAASGLPVITTNAPGCREAVVDGKTGFLCKPRDVESLAEAMRKVLAMSDIQRSEMGQFGRLYMEEKFSETIVIEEYENAVRAISGLK